MKVYYEKPNAHALIAKAIALSCDYENKTGIRPNRIEMTKEEFNLIDEHLKYWLRHYEEKYKDSSLMLLGMEIIIK